MNLWQIMFTFSSSPYRMPRQHVIFHLSCTFSLAMQQRRSYACMPHRRRAHNIAQRNSKRSVRLLSLDKKFVKIFDNFETIWKVLFWLPGMPWIMKNEKLDLIVDRNCHMSLCHFKFGTSHTTILNRFHLLVSWNYVICMLVLWGVCAIRCANSKAIVVNSIERKQSKREAKVKTQRKLTDVP